MTTALPVKRISKFLILNDYYTFRIDKISMMTLTKVQNEDRYIHSLSIYCDGVKVEFNNESYETMRRTYSDLMEILLGEK